MTHYVYGERIGRDAQLGVGCCSVVYDDNRERILLLKRRDNLRWTLPGGMMEAGEDTTEACLRELEEETGLKATIERLIGVYTTPDRITEFPDGNRFQFVNLVFECTPVSGLLRDSDETFQAGYFSLKEIQSMDVLDPIKDWIGDAWATTDRSFIR